MNITSTAASSASRTTYTSTGSTSPENTALNRLFDHSISRYSEPLDPDLQALVLAIENEDFGAQAQVIILDLIRLMSQIRKQNQEGWQAQANLALKTANNVATAQKQQAKMTATSAFISSGAQIVQGVAEGVTAGVMAAKANSGMKAIVEESKGMDFSQGAGTASGEIATGPAEFTRGAGSPPAYTEKQSIGADLDDIKATNKNTGEAKAQVKPGDDEGAAKGPTNNADPYKTQRSEWVNDKVRNMYSQMDIYQRVITAIVSIGTGGMKQFSAWQELAAGEEQAAATLEQAVMNYLQSQSQYSNEYAAEMREAVKAAIELMKSTEQARHQARNAIVNIV